MKHGGRGRKDDRREPSPVPNGHDRRGRARELDGEPPKRDVSAPDGISGSWE